MSLTNTLVRGRLAMALALLLGGAALAGETLSEETRVLVRTASGAVERLTVGELALGETRAVATDSGAGALVTRTETGIRLEVAGETFDIDLPAPGEAHALAAAGVHLEHEVARSVERGTDGDADHDKQHVVVIKRRHLSDENDDPALSRLDLLEDPELLIADGDDGKRVVVVRRVVHKSDGTAD